MSLQALEPWIVSSFKAHPSLVSSTGVAWNAKLAVFLMGVIIKMLRIPAACLATTQRMKPALKAERERTWPVDILGPLIPLAPELPAGSFYYMRCHIPLLIMLVPVGISVICGQSLRWMLKPQEALRPLGMSRERCLQT